MGALPLDETSVTNQVNNYAEKLSYRDMNNLKARGEVLKAKKLTKFSKKADQITNRASKDVNSQFRKNSIPSVSSTEAIINISTENLTDLRDSISAEFESSITTYAYNMTVEFTSAVSAYTDNLISQMSNPSIPTMANIRAAAVNAISSLTNQLLATATTIWQSFVVSLTNLCNKYLAQIAGLVDTFNNLIDSASAALDNGIAAVNKYSKMTYDFYKRVKGVSSTSEYIQTNVPDAKGALKANTSVLATTPDAKIIIPKLKFDINLVKYFKKNPLSSMFPSFVPSLIPLVKLQDIVEAPPTSTLNQYGFTEVNGNKSGFTEIKTSNVGNVTKTVLHPSGSNERVLNDGSKINKTVGDITQITDGNWDITTSKDKVEIVVGDHKFEIRKDYVQTVKGDANINVDKNRNTVIGQDVVNDFKSNYDAKISGYYKESVGGNKVETTGGNLTEMITGNHNETVVGGLTILVTGNVNVLSHGVTNITGSAAVNVTSAGLVKITGVKVLLG